MNLSEIKRETMLSLVAQWRESGQTQKVFCHFHGIKVGTLAYWIKRSSEEESESRFTEIRPSMVPASGKIEVIYPNGVRISTDGDLSLIAKLSISIKCLRSVPLTGSIFSAAIAT